MRFARPVKISRADSQKSKQDDVFLFEVGALVDWEEFSVRFAAELQRLGVKDHDARFLGFEMPDERLFELLSILPDGAGTYAFYRHLGADFDELEKQEAEGPPLDA